MWFSIPTDQNILTNLNHKITPAILAGGLGTRLRSIVGDMPKVLAPVNGKPFLSYLLDQLIAAGFHSVILCTGYSAHMIAEIFGTQYKELNIRYSHEPAPLGTGGALRYALPIVEKEIILVMNGDSFMDIGISGFLEWHLRRNHKASMVLTKMEDADCFGKVDLDEQNRITCFQEKTQNVGWGWVNAGIYLLRKTIVASIPPGKKYSLETDYFPSLAGEGLCGYKSDGRFIDIGTPECYSRAGQFLAERT